MFDTYVWDRLHYLAEKSTMKQKHGAVIIKNGEIIGEGTNYTVGFMCHQYSIHSEVAAILSLKKNNKNRKYLEDAIMIVVRVTGKIKKSFNLSSPCENCKKAIEKTGIRTVYYST